MIRGAVAVAALLCLSPSSLAAQDVMFGVGSASASIHMAPSTGSPVIGHARPGAVLEVTRDLGSWMKVRWPDAKDGVGYVHVSTGSLSGGSTSAAKETHADAGGRAAAGSSTASLQPAYVATPTHMVGLGGLTGGSSLGSGVSARAWLRHRLGLQFEVSRSGWTPIGSDRVTSMQFAPSLLYSLPDHVTDYVWVRPYLGAGPRMLRQTAGVGPQGSGISASETSTGLQTFGGAELTFSSVPRLALSADVRYGWAEERATGPDFGGLGFSLSGHWYIK